MGQTITTSRATAQDLLDWYDRHHRTMPWRVDPADRARGVRPDPYHVWLSEVMLQQTTVVAVTEYFRKFLKHWPDVHALAAAPQEDVLAAWAGLGYYARARNLYKCAQFVSRDLGGVFPETEDDLRALPGVGAYTSAAIAAIAFDRPAVVVDGNVERVMSRIFADETPLPDLKAAAHGLATQITPQKRPGDYAQAVMDLGATICTPKRPACALCPWRPACKGYETGIAETLPRRKPKAAKPIRIGAAWVLFDTSGQVLTVRRPEKGLLGGMLAVPSSDWSKAPDLTPPLSAQWREVGEIRHTFTHFHLRLTVMTAQSSTAEGDFRDPQRSISDVPTVFAKVLRLALAERDSSGR